MELDLSKLLSGSPTLLTFLVIGCGYLIGNLKIVRIQIGSTTGVLLAGLVFGHLGFANDPNLATFGFTLFIFCIGLQAGPRFFGVFLEDGPKYIVLAMVVALTAFVLARSYAALLDFDFGLSAGLLAGALTSTPTLAGAQDAITSGIAATPADVSASHAVSNVSVGYAITYVFGTAGLILVIRYAPTLLRIDLAAEAASLARERGLDDEASLGKRRDIPVVRAYRMPNEVDGQTLRQLQANEGEWFTPLAIRRGETELELDLDVPLQTGDVVSAIVSLDVLRRTQVHLGEEVLDQALLDYEISTGEIVVTRPEVVGRPIKELRLMSEHGCFPTGLIRSRVPVPVHDDLALSRGDRLQLVGETQRLHKLAKEIGHIESEIEETDLLTFALGIVGGLALGTLLVKLGNLSIGLGSAGGLLLIGILIGFLRSAYPTFGRVPAPARFILMQLGLMLFLASVGLEAGSGVVDALTSVGPLLILCGVTVTLVPVGVAYLVGRRMLGMNPALLLGAVTGAMTSTPALSVVTSEAKSSLPALGYAGTYTFANVFLTFAGALMVSV
ncbi:MAG: TrkA C-terminal domain-containing protein [Pseudomonadota bacterium]